MKDWSLFLTHPTYGNECSTSEDTLNSPRGRFWVFKVPSSVRVLGKFPTDSAVLSFPHDNVVCNHSCYECRRSNEPSVCYKFWSILWLLGPVCLRTKECLVYQFAPNVDILGNFESILLTTLPPFPTVSFWSDGRQCMVHRVVLLANSQCRFTHFFAWPSMS